MTKRGHAHGYKDAFLEKHGVKLGFMSAFIKAASSSLGSLLSHGVIDNNEIIYRYARVILRCSDCVLACVRQLLFALAVLLKHGVKLGLCRHLKAASSGLTKLLLSMVPLATMRISTGTHKYFLVVDSTKLLTSAAVFPVAW
jgi:hypothetical protein